MWLINLLKKWTLPIAMSLGIVCFLIVKYVPIFQPVKPFFHDYIDNVIFVSLFILLFLTFCKINPKFLRITRWHCILFGIQTLMAIVLVSIARIFVLSPSVLLFIEAIFCCIVTPTAAAAAVVTGKFGVDITSTTAFALVSNLFSAFIITILCPILQMHNEVNLILQFFAVLFRVSQLLIAPFLLSWLVRIFLPKFLNYCNSFHDLAFYLWAFCLSLVMSQAVRGVVNNLHKMDIVISIALGALFICILQFQVGEKIGAHYHSKVAVRQSFGQKNTNFAVWLALVYFSPIVCIGPGFYALWQNIINSVELLKHEKKTKKNK